MWYNVHVDDNRGTEPSGCGTMSMLMITEEQSLQGVHNVHVVDRRTVPSGCGTMSMMMRAEEQCLQGELQCPHC